jgi:hypothetical protein
LITCANEIITVSVLERISSDIIPSQ